MMSDMKMNPWKLLKVLRSTNGVIYPENCCKASLNLSSTSSGASFGMDWMAVCASMTEYPSAVNAASTSLSASDMLAIVLKRIAGFESIMKMEHDFLGCLLAHAGYLSEQIRSIAKHRPSVSGPW